MTAGGGGAAAESENVAALLAAPVARRAGAAALVERSGARTRVTTFAALDLAARQAAALLRARGVGAGDGVLFFEPPSRELYAALVAVFRLGAVAMFVEPSAGRGVLDGACAMWPPRALVATPRAHLLRLLSPALRRIPCKVTTGGRVPGAVRLAAASRLAPDDALAPRTADDPALLTFTSGSTGAPKAAVRTHGVLRAQLAALADVAAQPGERELVSLPIVVLINLATGAESVLPDADLRRPGAIDPAPVLAQLAEHRAARITASPAFLERLAAAPGAEAGAPPLAAVRTVVTGGGPVFPDLVAALGRAAPRAAVVSVYGSTEAEPVAHVRDDELTDDDRRAMREGAGLLAGHPAACVALRVVEPRWGTPIPPLTGEGLDAITCPPTVPGEIVVAGRHVVPGYLHGRGDEETKFRVDGRVWHRTGDAGYLDASGRLWLLGRAGAVVRDDRGVLYPFAVECAARALLGGRRVAAVGHAGRRLLVVEQAGGPPPAGEGEAVRAALAFAALDGVVYVPRLPTDRRHNSKIDYPAVHALLAARGRDR